MDLCRDPRWRYFPTVSIPATSDESFVILHLGCAIRQSRDYPHARILESNTTQEKYLQGNSPRHIPDAEINKPAT